MCGEVFAHDKSTDCLLIKQPGAAPYLSNLVLLKASTVKARPDLWAVALSVGVREFVLMFLRVVCSWNRVRRPPRRRIGSCRLSICKNVGRERRRQ